MAFRFENLNVWHKSVDLANEIDTLVKSFPIEEKFSLCQQMKRAADSVVLNIAEGSTGQTKPEYGRFLNMALRSGIEVVAALHLAVKRNYICNEDFAKCYSEYEILCKMIAKLRNSL